VTFSSADYPLFLIAVFAVHALTRLGGGGGRLARMAVLVLLGDLVYLLLTKDVATLWDPLGATAFGLVSEESSPAWRQLPLGTAILGGALYLGWRYGGALGSARAQLCLAWGAIAVLVAIGVGVLVASLGDPSHGTDGMTAALARYGHLLFLGAYGIAVGASQTESGRPFGRVLVLFLASFVFYHAWSALQVGAYRYLTLLLVAIVVGDFLLGRAIHATLHPGRRKALLVWSLVNNLGVLALFKYYDFFTLDVLGLDQAPLHLVLPAGISFCTFQSLSYTIDVYRGQLQPTRSVVQFASFVLFFPQLVAGPIVRAHDLLPQMDRLPPLDRGLAADGLFRILVGLFKKIALADLLGQLIVDRVFDAPGRFSGLEVMIGVWAYAFQIYLDFSAYSDIAIGSAQLLGFRFPENFRTPYRSGNLQEFWRRWHMSLSTWLRDYLYIPLGGGRNGSLATYRNLILTMLLGGLWHGANWTFITWGALHGLGLAITRVFQRRADAGAPMGRWLAATLGIAIAGAILHVALLTGGDTGVLVHLIVAWIYTSPLWAASTAALTRDPEPKIAAPSSPGSSPRPPPPPAADATTHRRPSHAARSARRKLRRQRGSVPLPPAIVVADRRPATAVTMLRCLAAGIGAAALVWFIAWAAAPVFVVGADDGMADPAVPPPSGVLPLAIATWLIALIADAVERRPDAAFARRWLVWAGKRAIAVVLTFHYVCFAWIFFRSPSFDDAALVLGQIATLSTDTHSLLPQVKVVLGVALVAHFFAPGTYRWARDGFPRLPTYAQALVLVAAALLLRVLAATEAQPFIYFQF
jgi:alginate O-acetyltransferase complex protein AlgI